MSVRALRVVALSLAASLLAIAGTSAADWPLPRHDVRRTAWVDGQSNIETPAPFWRFYAGGTIDVDGVRAFDVGNDGHVEVLVVTGGRVAARDPADGHTLWSTPLLGADGFVGLGDLDGAGGPELVARSVDRVFVLDPASGTLLWSEPKGEMGTLGTALLADMDGDGADDVLVQECGCCGVQSANPGFAYRFRGGSASLTSPTVIFALPQVACGPAAAAVAIHMRSSAQTEFVNAFFSELKLLDGGSGVQIGQLGGFASYLHTSNCAPVEVDGDGREELLCAMKDASDSPGDGHRLYLARFTAGQLVLAWQQLVGDVERGLVIPPGWVADLDGDGGLEVVVGGKLANDQPITAVYDAASGALRTTIPGHHPAGTALLGGGIALLLTDTDDYVLHGWALAGSNAQELWSLPDRGVASDLDLPLEQRSWVGSRVLTYDVNGDGIDEILTAKRGLDADLVAHDVSSGVPVAAATYTPPADTSVFAAWRFPRSGSDQLLIAQSDGNLHELTPAWEALSGNESFGVRFGNYYSSGTFRLLRTSPVVASLGDGGPPGLLAQTSRGTLERLDATSATFAVGPERLWRRSATNGAVVAPHVDAGNPGIFAIETEDFEHHHIVALNAGGEELWNTELPGAALTDLLYGNLDGDGIDDAFVQWGSLFDFIEQNSALHGNDGSMAWSLPTPGNYTRQPTGGAIADWNGDGVDDLVHRTERLRVRDGTTGQEIVQSPPGFAYATPILYDVDGDGDDDATLTATFEPLSTYDHDLQATIWAGTDDDRPLTYGTIATCPGRPPILLHGSWQFPSRLKLVDTSGPTAGAFETIVLAGGGLYPTEAAAEAAGAEGGQLGSPTGYADLGGDGRPQVAIGSTDGWLYLIDPCALELRHSLYFDAPVGAAIFADADGDGFDEIIVSVADGYLYGIEQTPVPAPEEVLDIDPPSGILDQDVDEIRTKSTLYARWTPVDGVDSYELAVVRAEIDGGGFITDGPWIDVGVNTVATIENLPLEAGKRYHVAVRAVAMGLRSPDTLSDGVLIIDEEPPGKDKGEPEPVWLVGRSCVYFCSTPASPNDRWAPALAAGLVALALVRRRSTIGR
jgi:outer membrane protein assembly factor BamB